MCTTLREWGEKYFWLYVFVSFELCTSAHDKYSIKLKTK